MRILKAASKGRLLSGTSMEMPQTSRSDIFYYLCHSSAMSDITQETRVRINQNGRVVIPAPFRKALGIRVGDEIVLRVEENELRITTLKNRLARAQNRIGGYLKKGTRLSEELIAERRAASQRE